MSRSTMFVQRIRQLESFISEANEFLDLTRAIYNDIIAEENKTKELLKLADGEKLIYYKHICVMLEVNPSNFEFYMTFNQKNTLTPIKVGKATKYRLSEVREKMEYLKFLKDQCN